MSYATRYPVADTQRRGQRLVRVQVSVKPTEEPIRLDEVYPHLGFAADGSDVDTLTAAQAAQYLATARPLFEDQYGLAFITQTVVAKFRGPLPDRVRLPRRPATTLTEVATIATDGTVTVQTLGNYRLIGEDHIGADSAATVYDGIGELRVTYTAGLADDQSAFLAGGFELLEIALAKTITDLKEFKPSMIVGAVTAVNLPNSVDSMMRAFIQGRGWT